METTNKTAQEQMIRAVRYINNHGIGYTPRFLKGAARWQAYGELREQGVLELKNSSTDLKKNGFWINEQKYQQWLVNNS